jgi:predicted Zn-dependent protease
MIGQFRIFGIVSTFVFAFIFALTTVGCGQTEQRLNERQSWVHRREDVPFAESRPKPSADVVAASDQVDALERLFDDGRDGECREQLAAFFANGGDHPRAHDLNGRLLALAGDYAAAAEAFGRAVAASPRWLEPRLAQAECYMRLERPAAASSVYAELDRLMPKAPWGPWGQGVIAARGNNRDRAIAFLDEALQRDPEHAPSLRVRATLAAQAGETDREQSLLLRYITQAPEDAGAWTRLGDLAESANRLIDAVRYLGEAYDLGPDPRLAKRIAGVCERAGDSAGAARWRSLTRP